MIACRYITFYREFHNNIHVDWNSDKINEFEKIHSCFFLIWQSRIEISWTSRLLLHLYVSLFVCFKHIHFMTYSEWCLNTKISIYNKVFKNQWKWNDSVKELDVKNGTSFVWKCFNPIERIFSNCLLSPIISYSPFVN